jgi:hypothetical protein
MSIPFQKNILIVGLFLAINQTLIALNPDSSKHYFLIIQARGMDFDVYSKTFSLTGHAFVSWATQSGEDSLVLEKTAGFFPNKNANWFDMILDTLEGHVNTDFEANSNDLNVPVEQIMLPVDSTHWLQSQQVAQSYQQKNYNLLGFNCVSFVDKVVAANHLKQADLKYLYLIPASPLQYLKQFYELNRDKVVQIRSLQKIIKATPVDSAIANVGQTEEPKELEKP